jgi:predicted MFS family arabinose efflux permease
MADSKPAAYGAPAAQALPSPIADRVRPNAKLIALLRNSETASGLIVGFAIGAGGLGVTALGWIADRYGLPAALWISAAMPLVAFVAARFLPAPRALETW